MEIEGRLDILRLDRPTDPEPWTYDVTYLPNRVSGWAKLHKCVGLESLVAYLGEVGILPEFIKRALEEVQKHGQTQIPTVRLTRERLEALVLL